MSSKRFLYLGLLIAALIVAACSPTPAPTSLPPTDTPALTATTEATTEATTTGESKVPMGFTEEGAPYQGNPDAPVTLVEYSEFQ
ncbi:MAG: hypothetical protein DRI52_12120 [Chloroflexi bacterium]|nr:hypothetical protein [Anaerolineae bacterium]RLC66376.1 MAG: hypothetical protein DRI52_12120 [Chloroflexota bacterium]